MNGGTITGNSSSSSYSSGGGGVSSSGTFTMNGGTISGNYSSSSSSYGGGVSSSGTFTMSGGTISGNYSSFSGGGVWSFGTFTMSGGTISGNSASYSGGGVSVDGSGTFAMGNDARIEPSNEVYLNSGGNNSITLAGDFSGSDTIAVIDLGGGVTDWLGKPVLLQDSEYTGTIPVDRFTLGNFVSGYYPEVTKTPIANYVINSEGRLVNK
jgi:hypothetical protein